MLQSVSRSGKVGLSLVLLLSLLLVAGAVFADWWTCLPSDAVAEYVGGQNCLQCHQAESQHWQGSHHDLAMDLATSETVLGDFDDATIEHQGITSRMFRDGERYMVSTEGPDGQIADFEVKYVFGVEPLQQYMVEFNRPAGMPNDEIAQLQVLRISWDTKKKQWFYLNPPDVTEKLKPDDPLHWTGSAQNWNHMCADCHSTNLQKNFDVATQTYHTTFSEIDVSCEACHGPGSHHVALASAKSLFWDRKQGFGLAKLKGEDSQPQLHACAPCHSRRSVVASDYHSGENYYDHYANELLAPDTYYCDGQALDEVYVFGSFIQSKMYQEGVRCTDCHNPHTTKVKFDDNRLCTSCHAHDPAKYDTPAHHRHNVGSKGALCVECHMTASPFMDVDLRRDHSMQIPRPEVSVALGTPNACTGCHLEKKNVASEKHESLVHYADWLRAVRDGDQEVRAEVHRVDQWATDTVDQWYGDLSKDPSKQRVEFAATLKNAWAAKPDADAALMQLATNRRAAPMIRASALNRLGFYPTAARAETSIRLLTDRDPQVRAAAVRNLADLPTREMLKYCLPLLDDPIRYVRIEAALTLAPQHRALTTQQERKLNTALDAYRAAMNRNADQASAHLALGILAERQEDYAVAEAAYRTAIRVQPGVTGPRGNLAALLDRQRKPLDAQRLRAEELQLLARDAEMAPGIALVQYRFGLASYLAGEFEAAETAIARAVELEPDSADYSLALALLYQKLERFEEAIPLVERIVKLQPDNQGFQNVLRDLRHQLATQMAGPKP